MTNVFLGQITMFGGNYNPRGFAFCNGQTLPIAQNQALFSLLGTTYGGNGTTTFALPNLQSRLPVHQGQGPGLSTYALGQNGGVPTVTIDQSTTPTHIHSLTATAANATTPTIANNVLPARQPTGSPPNSMPIVAGRRRCSTFFKPLLRRLQRGRRQPAAHQFDALAVHHLHHRPAGHLPVA